MVSNWIEYHLQMAMERELVELKSRRKRAKDARAKIQKVGRVGNKIDEIIKEGVGEDREYTPLSKERYRPPGTGRGSSTGMTISTAYHLMD